MHPSVGFLYNRIICIVVLAILGHTEKVPDKINQKCTPTEQIQQLNHDLLVLFVGLFGINCKVARKVARDACIGWFQL